MNMWPPDVGYLLLVITLLTGCAAQPSVMRYANGVPVERPRVWPAEPDIARYQYVGQLTGDANFGPSEEREPSAATRLFRWLIGLGQNNSSPRVLLRPQSGAVDALGKRLYITDMGRQAVFVFDEGAGELLVWDQADGSQGFISPVGITLGRRGEILVADAQLGRIVRLDREGQPLGSFGAGILQRPTGLARDPETGRLYVADTHAHDIKVFDDSGRLLHRIGHRGSAPGEFNAPTHLAFAADQLYVSDTLNARIQILTSTGKPLKHIGQRGLYVGNLTRAKGVAVDSDENVYIVESYYDHLLVFDREGRFLLPIGGTGSEVGRFFLPAGVWSDAQNRIYIADMFNGRVVIMQYLGG